MTDCICGHTDLDHTNNGPCHEPTGRCQCTGYAELCPACRHAKTSHNGAGGRCVRIKTVRAGKELCACTNYPSAT